MISIILEHVCISDLSDKHDRLPELENQIRVIDLAGNSWQAILNYNFSFIDKYIYI